MMNTFGYIFRITTFGESHGKAVGVIIDGCPPNISITENEIQKELDRRKPGQSAITTPRKENDKIEFFSGIFNGKTTGHPIMMMAQNKNQQSKDYSNIKEKYRPSHADYTYDLKYGIRDHRGGGRSSARETIGRVAAGALAKKILTSANNIKITGFVTQIGNVQSSEFNEEYIEKNPVRCADKNKAKKMEDEIRKVQKNGDSVGGIVEIRVKNIIAGLGSPTFAKIKADLASALMSIPGVKGFEYGSGFQSASMKGSEHNDEFFIDNKNIRTKTNHHGGILGGITTGEDLILRIVVKPTSSISKEQHTVNNSGEETMIQTFGRHDPCLAPRLVPIAESMVALVLVDHWLLSKTI